MVKRMLLTLLLALPAPVQAQMGNPPATDPQHPGTFLLTIFLRHDETKTLPEINQALKSHGWYKSFPPPGVEIVSWYVMMGIGQVVTLRVPAEKLREVNRVIENSAWGGYHTEFYPTYDYRQAWEDQKQQMNAP